MFAPYLVSDVSVECALQGQFFGDVYILLHWESFHDVMGHEGLPERCEECAIMFARQFQPPGMRGDDHAW